TGEPLLKLEWQVPVLEQLLTPESFFASDQFFLSLGSQTLQFSLFQFALVRSHHSLALQAESFLFELASLLQIPFSLFLSYCDFIYLSIYILLSCLSFTFFLLFLTYY